MDKRILVFGDIHGCYEKLKTLVENIKIQESDILIFLGDYIDRGLESRKVLDYLISLKDSKLQCIFLRGNHEQMFLDFLKEPSQTHDFLHNGGWKTLENFKKEDGGWDIPDKYIEFLNSTQYLHIIDDYFFCHAGVPNKQLKNIKEEDLEKLLWSRDEFLNNEMDWESKIIHGHTPTKEVEFKDNRINIDTGCVFGGKLTCLVLPSEELIQI